VADLKARGLTPLSDQSFTDGTTDLTAQVLAIKKANATALISYFSAPDSLLPLAREMHQVGVHLTWLGSSSLGAMRIRQAGGALLYNTYVAQDYAPGQSPEAIAFARASEATFHLSATFEAAYVYDGLQILAMVMRKVGASNRAIRQGILDIKGYRGVEGTYTFDRNGDGLHQDAIVQNVQGRLRVIKLFTF
jgi:branched-chain amino acid transport system substrate-binding protein